MNDELRASMARHPAGKQRVYQLLAEATAVRDAQELGRRMTDREAVLRFGFGALVAAEGGSPELRRHACDIAAACMYGFMNPWEEPAP